MMCMMQVLANTTEANILQYVSIPNQHAGHIKYA